MPSSTGQAQAWTEEWFNGHGLYRLRSAIRYPRSDDFRRRWAAHDVQIHTTGIKLIHHPVVGDLDLPYESFPLSHHLTQSLLTYTAEPGSPTQDALTLLASWAASTAHRSNASEHENT